MKFKRVTIENFKSIGPSPITINLDFNDTVLLLGKNGVGKTTMFDAIVWCIYGVTKLKADNVVNKFIGKNTKVEIEFSEGGKDYIITRYRKHDTHRNNVYLFEDGNNITLKNMSDTQNLIQDIVGIDIKAFLSSIVLSSETYKQFLRETNSVRLQIFESVFSLKELNTFNKLNRQNLLNIQKSKSEKKSQLDSVESFINSDTEALKSYKRNYETMLFSIEEDNRRLELEVKTLESQLEAKQDIDFDLEMEKAIKAESDRQNIEILRSSLNNMKANLSVLSVIIKDLESKKAEYEDIMSKYSYDIFKAEIDKINRKAKQDTEIKAIEDENVGLKADISKIKANIAELEGKANVTTLKIDGARKQLADIANHICPVCGNVIDDEHTHDVEQKANQVISENEAALSRLKVDIDVLRLNLKESEDKLTENENKLSQFEDIEIAYTVSEIKVLLSKLKEATDSMPDLKSNLDKKRAEELTLRASIAENTAKLEGMNVEVPYSVSELNTMKSEIVRIKSAIDIKKASIEANEKNKAKLFDTTYVNKVVSNIKARMETKNGLEAELVELSRKEKIYNTLDTVFSNGEGGFKKYFINSIIGLFNDKVNTFLPFFFEDEISITFDKDLNDTIVYRGKEAEFDELSSGEKTRCELCVVFSLYFMVKILFGKDENSLMVIDEIIDRGLDDVGVAASKQILDDIAKDTAIFVVTHRDDLKELFDKAITVYKDGDGFTRIK